MKCPVFFLIVYIYSTKSQQQQQLHQGAQTAPQTPHAVSTVVEGGDLDTTAPSSRPLYTTVFWRQTWGLVSDI